MSTALELAALNRRLRELTPGTPEREAYLDKLAADIRNGRYHTDSKGLADALLRALAVDREPRDSRPEQPDSP